MADAAQEAEPMNTHGLDLTHFHGVLEALVGKTVTCANPESYEDAPLGHHIAPRVYRARVSAVKHDYLTLVTEFKHVRGNGPSETATQFVPIARIKRVSAMKGEKILHL